METSDFNYCRTCLSQNNGNMKELVGFYDNELKFSDLLNYLLGTSETLINLPTFLCNKCETILIQSYLFKKQCLESKRQFLQLYVKLEIAVEDCKEADEIDDPLLLEIDSQNEEESFVDDDILETDETELITLENNIEGFKSIISQDNLKQNEQKLNKRLPNKHITNHSQDKNTAECSLFKNGSEDEMHVCPQCGKHVEDLSIHQAIHNNTDENFCDKFDNSFSTKRNLKADLRTHTGDRRHQCEYCGKKFKYRSYKKSHIESVHTKVISLACKFCDRKFHHKGNLARHIKIHTGEKPFECSICSRRFITTTLLKDHITTHTKERNEPCTICFKNFSTKASLFAHMKTHSKKCKICSKHFEGISAWQEHYKTHKTNSLSSQTKKVVEKNFICEICSKSFANKPNLLLHKRVHSKKCKICLKEFDGSTALREHFKSHANDPVSKIEIDPFEYNTNPIQCHLCGKKIYHKSSFNRHIRSHTGEKPFECSYCSRRFITSTLLKEHITIHTKEKNSICTICDKGFSTNRALTVHMKTHKKKLNL